MYHNNIDTCLPYVELLYGIKSIFNQSKQFSRQRRHILDLEDTAAEHDNQFQCYLVQ